MTVLDREQFLAEILNAAKEVEEMESPGTAEFDWVVTDPAYEYSIELIVEKREK